jgi:hypothetical protein
VTFIERVQSPGIPHQADTWGLAGDDIEEISLRRTAQHMYLEALSTVIDGEWSEPSEAFYIPETSGQTTYEARHVLPFLMDLFASSPRHLTVGWVGGRADTFRLFCSAWRKLGFRGDVLISPWSRPLLPQVPGVQAVSRVDLDRRADVMIFDFGPPSSSSDAPLPLPADSNRIDWAAALLSRDSFYNFVADERRRVREGSAARQVVCVDAIHNDNEAMIREEINAASTPFASRLRHGYVIPRTADRLLIESYEKPFSLLDRVRVGESGRRTSRGIKARLGHRGYLLTGPDVQLPAGEYRIDFSFRPSTPFSAVALMRPIIIEVVAGSECLMQREVHSVFWTTATLTFRISEKCQLTRGLTEVRLVHGRSVDFVISDITLSQVMPLIPPEAAGDDGRLLALANSLDGIPPASARGGTRRFAKPAIAT